MTYAQDAENDFQEVHRITMAQAVLSNWSTEEVPGIERGTRIGLATWDLLDGQTIAELMSWLQFAPANDDDSKQIFTMLRDGRLVWAQLHALAGPDDLGRRARRFWGQALIADELPQACGGHSPLRWWDSLPFFDNLDHAKRSIVEGSENSLSPAKFEIPRHESPQHVPPIELRDSLLSMFDFLRSDMTSQGVPLSVPREEVNSARVTEPYRIVQPADWGMLPVDDGFDGLQTRPGRRLWVVGRRRPVPGRRQERDVPATTGIGLIERWVLDLVEQDNWSDAVTGIAVAEQAVVRIREGTIDPGDYPRGDPVRLTFLEKYGSQAIVEQVAELLRREGWPPAMAEEVLLGLESFDFDGLALNWRFAVHSQSRSLRCTDFLGFQALLSRPVINPDAISAFSNSPPDLRSPLVQACVTVAAHAYLQSEKSHRILRRPDAPDPEMIRPLDELDVNLLERWSRWVFRCWPGAPYELTLPDYSEVRSEWWTPRAERVVSCCESWVNRAVYDEELMKSLQRWLEHLRTCGQSGSRLAERLAWYSPQLHRASKSAPRQGQKGKSGSRFGRRK